MNRKSTPPLPWLKPALFVGAVLPVGVMFNRGVHGDLGANPIGEALNQLGLLALIFIVAALACTPLKTLVGWTWPLRVRRMLGVFGFFYAVLHVSTYTALDQGFDWSAIYADVTKRRFIFVGSAAFLLLVPLAVTSTNAAVKRLGFVRWKRLHRLAYVAPMLGVVHFYWRVKRDVSEPVTYAVILATLLVMRLVPALRARLAATRADSLRGSTGVPAPQASQRA